MRAMRIAWIQRTQGDLNCGLWWVDKTQRCLLDSDNYCRIRLKINWSYVNNCADIAWRRKHSAWQSGAIRSSAVTTNFTRQELKYGWIHRYFDRWMKLFSCLRIMRTIDCSHHVQRVSAKHGVKDDFAFLWEHAIFRHPPNKNPLTDRSEILHSWLRRRDHWTCQKWLQSVG
jgi:hypothetical protein